MWDLQTIIAINQKAVEFAAQGLPERDAMVEVGIDVPTIEGKDKRVAKNVANQHSPA